MDKFELMENERNFTSKMAGGGGETMLLFRVRKQTLWLQLDGLTYTQTFIIYIIIWNKYGTKYTYNKKI